MVDKTHIPEGREEYMKLGIIGLPNAGKSTLFNALTNAGAECANYPFCTIDPNVGVVPIPDARPEKLAGIFNSGKVTYATIEFVDIAGLVKGASKGEGLGNRFLSHIREVDALVHVVRCFDDESVAHVDGSVDPVRDAETINFELIFADMETLDRRIERTMKAAKSGGKKYADMLTIYERIKEGLESGVAVRQMALTDEEKDYTEDLFLLTSKPVIYVANIPEKDLPNGERNIYVEQLRQFCLNEGSELIAICASMEEEVSQLDDADKHSFLNEMGLDSPGLIKLVNASYNLLGLISFLTANRTEARAWPIKKGTPAHTAAGKIHSDFERGFIRAEVIPFSELEKCGSYLAAKEKGLVRSEGREYIVQDGDVILFRFNV